MIWYASSLGCRLQKRKKCWLHSLFLFLSCFLYLIIACLFFFFISSSFFKYSAHENNGAQQIKANKQTAFKRHRCCGHVEFGEVEIPSPAIYFFFKTIITIFSPRFICAHALVR